MPSTSTRVSLASAAVLLLAAAAGALSMQPQGQPGAQPPDGRQPGGPQGPGGPDRMPFGPGGPGGFGGMGPMRVEQKILKQFDADGNGWLNAQERAAARKHLEQNPQPRRGPMGPGGPGGPGNRMKMKGPPGGEPAEPARPGEKIAPGDVAPVSGGLYDTSVVRTIFLEFESSDWEKELEIFHNTDVEVPATMVVDGKRYPLVGVKFRGASSYMMVPTGSKRSFNVSLDLADPKQRLDSARTLNLLNAHEDATFMHSVLYLDAARRVIPAPRANFVRVVVNGESWGLYTNAQQFDRVFVQEQFGQSKGARWKVPGSPQARGGLEYLGDDIEPYRRHYEIKSSGDDASWRALINLCKVLNTTPPDQLEAALRPILDVDGLLWFLAIDVALINGDGYWTRASDYSLYLDPDGRFHVIPHDANETFGPAMGPPMGGGRFGPKGPPDADPRQNPPRDNPQRDSASRGDAAQPADPQRPQDQPQQPGGPARPGPFGGGGSGGGGVELDPLIGLNDAAKPLRSKVLAVPALRTRYLANIRRIAEDWLDWRTLGPIVAAHRRLIEPYVKADTRKLTSYGAFLAATADEPPAAPNADQPAPRARSVSLRQFAERRRAYLLNHPAIKDVAPAPLPAGAPRATAR